MALPQSRSRPLLYAGMIALPLLAMTVYLLWLWPRPSGTSFLAQAGPYLVSLLIGCPCVFSLAPPGRRLASILGYLVVGFVLLWIYALGILCGVRGVCL